MRWNTAWAIRSSSALASVSVFCNCSSRSTPCGIIAGLNRHAQHVGQLPIPLIAILFGRDLGQLLQRGDALFDIGRDLVGRQRVGLLYRAVPARPSASAFRRWRIVAVRAAGRLRTRAIKKPPSCR